MLNKKAAAYRKPLLSFVLFSGKARCHRAAVGLSANNSTASAILIASRSVPLVYQIFPAIDEETLNIAKRIY